MTESNSPPTTPAASAPPAAAATRPAAPPPRSGLFRRYLWPAAVLALVLVVGSLLIPWTVGRLTTSETDDAFVEAHIVNVAPEMVSGHIVRFLAEEDQEVKQGDPLAEIDPTSYQDQVNVARTQLETAQCSSTASRRKCPFRSRSPGGRWPPLRPSTPRRRRCRGSPRTRWTGASTRPTPRWPPPRLTRRSPRSDYDRYTNLFKNDAATKQRAQQAERARDDANAQVNLASAKLALARAERRKNDVAVRDVEAALTAKEKAEKGVDLARIGDAQIREAERQRDVRKAALQEAEDERKYTTIVAPFPGRVVKRYRNLGDFASPGVAVLSMYNPDLLYVTANLEEDRLPGVAPGNSVRIDVDAVHGPFKGRVVWINKSTGAEFALMPRNVVSGEFTRVVQRVPVRIWIDKDDRWPQLRAGLSARVSIAHGGGDPEWARKTAQDMADLETRYNQLQLASPPPEPGEPK